MASRLRQFTHSRLSDDDDDDDDDGDYNYDNDDDDDECRLYNFGNNA